MPQSREAAEQHFTITAAVAFGWVSMELLVHLVEDYHLFKNWRWGHITYFGARYCGLLTATSFMVLASGGRDSGSLCQGFYVLAHITSSLLFIFSGAMFWIRAGFLCQWKRLLMIPLALYGLVVAALAMRSSISDYNPTRPDIPRTLVCALENSKDRDQGILRFLMAAFDILTAIITFTYLYKRKTPGSWLQAVLSRDQLIYVVATTLTYVVLAMDLLLNKVSGATYLGVLCPSIVSILSCRLFLRLKQSGNETHHITLNDLSSSLQSHNNPQSRDRIFQKTSVLSPWTTPSGGGDESCRPDCPPRSSSPATGVRATTEEILPAASDLESCLPVSESSHHHHHQDPLTIPTQ